MYKVGDIVEISEKFRIKYESYIDRFSGELTITQGNRYPKVRSNQAGLNFSFVEESDMTYFNLVQCICLGGE